MVEIKKKKSHAPNTSQIQQDKFMFLGERITWYNLLLTLQGQSPVYWSWQPKPLEIIETPEFFKVMHLLESGTCLKTNPLLCQQRAPPHGLTLALSEAPNILVVLETKRREGRRKSSGINHLNLHNINKTNSKSV